MKIAVKVYEYPENVRDGKFVPTEIEVTQDKIKKINLMDGISEEDKPGEYLYIMTNPNGVTLPQLYYKAYDGNSAGTTTGVTMEEALTK